MSHRIKLRKREIALALGIGAAAALAVTGILSDGFGGPGSSFKAVGELRHDEAPPLQKTQ